MTLSQLAARTRANLSHLVAWAFIGVGLFLMGYLIGYYTGSDRLSAAAIECSSGWRQTMDSFGDCARNLEFVTDQCSKLAASCEKIQSERCTFFRVP